jgi:hypothetical protein
MRFLSLNQHLAVMKYAQSAHVFIALHLTIQAF